MINEYIKNKRGISLLEALVYIAISALVLIIAVNFVVQGYTVYNFGQEQNDATASAQKGVEAMIKEIREARYADNGSYPLELANDQEFIFYSDVDQDDNVEKVRYFLEGTDFRKGVIKPSAAIPATYDGIETITTLSQSVRNATTSIFYYYTGEYSDWPNNPLPAPARLIETKMMRVYLKINVNPLKAPDDFELESTTQIRNLKTNL